MALTVTPFAGQSPSPYAVQLNAQADAAGGTADFTLADLINLCVKGPLKKFLQGLDASAWVLQLGGTDLLINVQPYAPALTPAVVSVSFFGGGPVSLRVVAPATASGVANAIGIYYRAFLPKWE